MGVRAIDGVIGVDYLASRLGNDFVVDLGWWNDDGMFVANCFVQYETAGTPDAAFTNRGKLLGMMDAELTQACSCSPLGVDFKGWRVFTDLPVFEPITVRGDIAKRQAIVRVWAYKGMVADAGSTAKLEPVILVRSEAQDDAARASLGNGKLDGLTSR